MSQPINRDSHRYEAPKLTVFGSVKQQTHGATSRTNDASGNQSGKT